MATKYPIKHRGETYYASDLTDDLKFKFCVWVYNNTLDNAKRYKTAKAFMDFDKAYTSNPPEWTSFPEPDVLAALDDPKGQHQLMRLILNLDSDAMNDDDFNAMVAEKQADECSDLQRAMKLIKDSSDPKAERGEPGSPRPADASEQERAYATNQSA